MSKKRHFYSIFYLGKMEQTIFPVEAIKERDVDLILLEELSADNSFCEWFINELSFPKLNSINGTWRSIADFGMGETDILFSYNADNKKIFVLIENKLDAEFQNEQFIRYTKRANEYIQNKKCDEAFVILVAPKLYCEIKVILKTLFRTKQLLKDLNLQAQNAIYSKANYSKLQAKN